jgi:hypothetical protein
MIYEYKVDDQMNNISDYTINLADSKRLTTIKPVNIDDLEAITNQIARKNLQEWLESSEETELKFQTRCCECGNYANYVSKRVGFVRSRFGLLRFKRAYYVCPHCHQSTCPLDERLDPVESLARLRARLAEGIQLPVAEMAKDWGLGSLKKPPSNYSFDLPKSDPGSNDVCTSFMSDQIEANSGDYFPNRPSI